MPITLVFDACYEETFSRFSDLVELLRERFGQTLSARIKAGRLLVNGQDVAEARR